MYLLSCLLEQYLNTEKNFNSRKNWLCLSGWAEQMQRAGYSSPALSACHSENISSVKENFEKILKTVYPDAEMNQNFLIRTVLSEYENHVFASAVDCLNDKNYLAEKFHYLYPVQKQYEKQAECFLHQLPLLLEFLAYAEKNHWYIQENIKNIPIPDKISQKYLLPDTWLMFISYFSCCASPDEKVWFLTYQDYQNQNAFAWNEAEQLSLASAWDNTEILHIQAFWNQHLPVMFQTSGEYACYAINIKNQAVVYSSEPEFEETENIADNFPEFIKKLLSGEYKL